MNRLIIFFFFISLTGCGVKSPPVPPAGTELPSILGPYLEEEKND